MIFNINDLLGAHPKIDEALKKLPVDSQLSFEPSTGMLFSTVPEKGNPMIAAFSLLHPKLYHQHLNS
ncbi:hypothetical protein [Vibrio fluvialis]|uniref:hypothetical protein n=1 Tax=Vibrio fluvialis TaxID=676 RepID=UPI001EEC6000|nr:hypothetical protein [Vibrio fluvialis]MCG6368733.1 hypothetical protein [Vibrio fluvialis]MCG6377434.1 hypothetical protein [Vibrio fluvialis]